MITEIEIGKVYKCTSDWLFRIPRCVYGSTVFYSYGHTKKCTDGESHHYVEWFNKHHELAPKEIVKKEIDVTIGNAFGVVVISCAEINKLLNEKIISAKLVYEGEV